MRSLAVGTLVTLGTITWTDHRTNAELYRVAYAVERRDGKTMQLRLNDAGDLVEFVEMVATHPHFGGRRWWMLCPRCASRVGRLYLERGRFRCRSCHDLRYRSSQQAHRDERFCKRLGWDMSDLRDWF